MLRCAALRSVRVLDGRAGVSGLFKKHGDKGEKVGQGEDFFFSGEPVTAGN